MNAATALPPEFVIIRVFLADGSCHEATWTGEVWWLRRGAVIPFERVEHWEPIEPPSDREVDASPLELTV